MNGTEDLRYEDSVYHEKAQATKKAIDLLFKALVAPGRLRRRIIKVIFPEIVEVADNFRKEVFWWKSH